MRSIAAINLRHTVAVLDPTENGASVNVYGMAIVILNTFAILFLFYNLKLDYIGIFAQLLAIIILFTFIIQIICE